MLTHTDNQGKANMVDVGAKPVQKRTATATGKIQLQKETLELIKDNLIRKGDVISVAELAGIMAAKATSSLIPLCHPLSLTKVDANARLEEDGIRITTKVNCNGQTGVEMEALTACSIALLTIYDMCKAVDHTMVIGEIRLIEKKKEDIIQNHSLD